MTLYVYCAYPAMPKSKKNTLQNGLKRAEAIVVLIVYNRYLLSVTLHESGTRKSSLGLWLNNTEVHLTLVLVLTITQLQYHFQYRTRSYELLLLNLVYCCMILLFRLFTIPLIVTFHSKSSNKCYSHVVNWLKIIALLLFCFVFVCPML